MKYLGISLWAIAIVLACFDYEVLAFWVFMLPLMIFCGIKQAQLDEDTKFHENFDSTFAREAHKKGHKAEDIMKHFDNMEKEKKMKD